MLPKFSQAELQDHACAISMDAAKARLCNQGKTIVHQYYKRDDFMDDNNDSNAYLQAILQELRSSKQQLGFGHSPKPRYIYANRQYPDSLWYFWDGENKRHEPILFNALTGIIEKLETEAKEFKDKRSLKINLHIKAERNYVIESGIETMFSKGLLYAISKLPITAFSQAITIAVEPGEDEKVSFCRIYNPGTGQAVYAPYNEPVTAVLSWVKHSNSNG